MNHIVTSIGSGWILEWDETIPGSTQSILGGSYLAGGLIEAQLAAMGAENIVKRPMTSQEQEGINIAFANRLVALERMKNQDVIIQVQDG
jgi:hypothetical protein